MFHFMNLSIFPFSLSFSKIMLYLTAMFQSGLPVKKDPAILSLVEFYVSCICTAASCRKKFAQTGDPGLRKNEKESQITYRRIP